MTMAFQGTTLAEMCLLDCPSNTFMGYAFASLDFEALSGTYLSRASKGQLGSNNFALGSRHSVPSDCQAGKHFSLKKDDLSILTINLQPAKQTHIKKIPGSFTVSFWIKLEQQDKVEVNIFTPKISFKS